MSHDDIFIIDAILPVLKASNQKQAFHIITGYAAQATGLDQKKLLSRLMAKERQSASGIGHGVIIPHLTVPHLENPYVLFARLSQMIDYDSLDNEPVDLVCMILSPENNAPYHLRRLAYISRVLRDYELCESLRDAGTKDALQALLLGSSANKKKIAA